MDHKSLIQQIVAGDARAYEQLVRQYQRMVYTVCMRVLRNAEDAEEATQDTFVKAYQHLAGFGGSAKLSTWLYSIAYRTAISMGRRKRLDTVAAEDLAHPPAAPSTNEGHQTELKRVLDRALGQLEPEDATILSLYHLDELSVEEIVTVTGLGASNVKVKLHRGRKKLQEVLTRQLGPEAHALLFDHG
ncbi:MAG: sigma-70 family RNA polymerase sigma factor [Flavobacteriales bacterium]|nr:sigma-70 family RNA polymerase sigma factor [Flavobacteriales bacterium]